MSHDDSGETNHPYLRTGFHTIDRTRTALALHSQCQTLHEQLF
jgi:hypothetical protein